MDNSGPHLGTMDSGDDEEQENISDLGSKSSKYQRYMYIMNYSIKYSDIKCTCVLNQRRVMVKNHTCKPQLSNIIFSCIMQRGRIF